MLCRISLYHDMTVTCFVFSISFSWIYQSSAIIIPYYSTPDVVNRGFLTIFSFKKKVSYLDTSNPNHLTIIDYYRLLYYDIERYIGTYVYYIWNKNIIHVKNTHGDTTVPLEYGRYVMENFEKKIVLVTKFLKKSQFTIAYLDEVFET